ncbi:MAG: helix-turn-helix domain-containing protein [Chloroflexi bacterium]|nr:helix-turn-helix domain-containing protein [Chloroflexota bacterium]
MTATTNTTFADALRELMTDHSLSFTQLADLTPAVDGKGLGRSYLAFLASGQRQPTLANMQLLATVFGVTPRYFREYRESEAAETARTMARKHGVEAVLAKLGELD